MKKRNKHWERDKKYRKLLKVSAANSTAQRNLGYLQLKNPIPYGYEAYYVLRDDIANREDAWVFQMIIDVCGWSAWRKKNTFEDIAKRRTSHRYKHHNWDYPHFEGVGEHIYNQLPPEVKKWFSLDDRTNGWDYKSYFYNVPLFYFEVKVRRYYKTKVKLIDNVLIQEEKEIDWQLEELKMMGYGNDHYHVPKSYTRYYNYTDRQKAKQAIHKIIRDGREDVIFPGNHRHSASWDYW